MLFVVFLFKQKTAYDMRISACSSDVCSSVLLHGERIGEVAAGAVLNHSRDFNLCRESVMSSGLAPETAAYDLQMACGTGLQGAINIANKIALGQVESGIGGGVDTTSDAPIAVGDKLRKILLEVNRAKAHGQRLAELANLRPAMLAPQTPTNRSEERSVGKDRVSKCRSRWSPYH